jgi:hypothetical protein
MDIIVFYSIHKMNDKEHEHIGLLLLSIIQIQIHIHLKWGGYE